MLIHAPFGLHLFNLPALQAGHDPVGMCPSCVVQPEAFPGTAPWSQLAKREVSDCNFDTDSAAVLLGGYLGVRVASKCWPILATGSVDLRVNTDQTEATWRAFDRGLPPWVWRGRLIRKAASESSI